MHKIKSAFITGTSGAGKTTLVETLKKRNLKT